MTEQAGFDRDFRIYFGSSIVSFLGMQIGRVVLPLLCYQLTGSAVATAALLTVQMVPGVVFGLFAGALADRVDRRRIMSAGYLASGLALGIIPLASGLGVLSIAVVYVAALVSATCYVWAEAADLGALPALVGRERIVAASSLVHGAWTVSGVVGLPLGGVLAAAVGAETAVLINAVSFVLIAVAITFIRRHLGPVPGSVGTARGWRRVMSDVGEGLRFVRRHPIQWPVTLIGTVSAVATGAALSLVVVYGVRQLGISEDGDSIGVLYAAGAVGAFVAAAALPWIARRFAPGRIALLAQVVNALLLLGLATVSSVWAGAVLLGLWEFTLTLGVLNLIALRQRITPDRLQSRVNASVRLVAAGGQALGGMIGGVLTEATSVSISMVVLGASMAAVAVLTFISPVRRIDHAAVERAMADASEIDTHPPADAP